MKRVHMLLSLLMVFVLAAGAAGEAHAASQKILNQVKKEYEAYEKQSAKGYEAYREKTTGAYEKYRDREKVSHDRFVKQTAADLDQLTRQLQEDAARLEAQYGNSSSIRSYKSEINAKSLGSPMQKYAQSINPSSLGSHMTNYKTAINEVSLGSPMAGYKAAVNEVSLGSSMSKYRAGVNPNSLGSPMAKLRSESSPGSLGSTMAKYRQGKLTQKQALAEWSKSQKREGKALQAIISKAKKDIDATAADTSAKILSQKSTSINGILEQRNTTLQAISDKRKELFGEGITFEALLPDLGETMVMAGGKWLAVPQAPVVQDGVVFIPIRAVFEEVSPGMKLQKKGNVITMTSPDVKITIGSKKAVIHGKAATLEAAPKLINGQTMVPMELVQMAAGKAISWDATAKTVFIK